MTKRAFDKIAAGLREAIRVAELSPDDLKAIRQAKPKNTEAVPK